MSIIETINLEKTYHNDNIPTRVLNGVSLDIKEGEFLAIMGPSGSGKSTLLHILGFLDQHTRGEYLFEGKKVNSYNEEEVAHVRNQRMGFVFQAFNLLGRTSILENVKLPLLYSDIKKSSRDKIAKNAIESVGLSHRIDHEPSQLSGGEKQRVAIARALVNNPSIIFADEPTGNLDSKSGQAVMEIIQNLNEKEGHTIVLVTHETYTAEHAERIIRMLDGKIESDVKVNNRHKATEYFKK